MNLLIPTAIQFQNACRTHFLFLETDFNFKYSVSHKDAHLPLQYQGYIVGYSNETTDVTINFEIWERLPTVKLMSADPALPDVFNLGLILSQRAPHLDPLREFVGFPIEKSVETLLAEYSVALRSSASDILGGDFSFFPELRRRKSDLINRLLEKGKIRLQ